MKPQYSLILAASFMFYNLASGFEFTDCGSKNGKLTTIEVSGCNTTSNACVLTRNTHNPIKIGFTVYELVTDVIAEAYGQYQKYFYLLLEASHVCSNISPNCPLQKGTNHEYKGILTASKVSTVPVLVRWRLYDQNKEVIVCVKFPAIIQ